MSRRTIRRIGSEPDVIHAVVTATEIARGLDLSEADSRTVGTVVSELATNIIKYAERGRVTIQEVESGGRVGVQVTVSDQGPGIANVQEALQDHFSSSGTLGLGLPGVRRMMDDFEFQSEVGVGTTITVRKWTGSATRSQRRRGLMTGSGGSAAFAERGTARGSRSFTDPNSSNPSFEVAFVNRPCRGELVSGDAVFVGDLGGGVLIGILDGLGHGKDANHAAKTATRTLREMGDADVGLIISRLDDRLRDTVGAAIGLCWIDPGQGQLRYAGVGNTVFRMEGDRPIRLRSVPGTVGENPRAPKVESVHFPKDSVLLLYTDGISDRASFDDYPQIRYQAAATIAETVVTRYGKSHDDATCVVCRYKK
jgi:anti-sigma regulatory factor (Ser/Thr protein kinase)